MKREKQPATPPTAYSYQRFSSPEQARGDSLRRQSEARDRWLATSGAVLDTSLVMTDRGVSAYSGAHRSNPERNALAAFLEHVKSGRVRRGSYLIVESLDRLTREHIRPALTLLLNLIDAGVKVVQLLPVEAVYDEAVEPMGLMMAIMELSRGNSESRMKSERVGKAWREKKRRAAAECAPLTRQLPAWVRLNETTGKLELIAEKAAVVRRVYRLAIEGHGLGAITKLLNSEEVKPLGRAAAWGQSYIAKLLTSRAPMGEYQPHRGHDARDRKPDGAPIPNYFPAVVDERTWYAARDAMASRKNTGGPRGKRVNIFSGLLTDARDGGGIISTDKGDGPRVVSRAAASGVKGTQYVSFPRQVLELALLRELREIDPAALVPDGNPAADRLAELQGRERALLERTERIKDALAGEGEVASAVAVLRDLDAQLVNVQDALATARREAASPFADSVSECRTLADALERNDTEDTRVRLRGAVRRAVEDVRCLFVAAGPWRAAVVQMWFRGIDRQRSYIVTHRGAKANAASKAAARWAAHSFAGPGGRELDLRKAADVKTAERLAGAVLDELRAG